MEQANKIYKDVDRSADKSPAPVFSDILARLQRCNSVLAMNLSELSSSVRNITGDIEVKGEDGGKGKEGVGYAFNINQELAKFEELNSAFFGILSSLKNYVG